VVKVEWVGSAWLFSWESGAFVEWWGEAGDVLCGVLWLLNVVGGGGGGSIDWFRRGDGVGDNFSSDLGWCCCLRCYRPGCVASSFGLHEESSSRFFHGFFEPFCNRRLNVDRLCGSSSSGANSGWGEPGGFVKIDHGRLFWGLWGSFAGRACERSRLWRGGGGGGWVRGSGFVHSSFAHVLLRRDPASCC